MNSIPIYEAKNESILEKAEVLRKKINDLVTNEDIDKIFSSSNEPYDSYKSDVFDGVS